MNDKFIVKAAVKIRTIYTCDLCGNKELGDIVTLEITNCQVEHLNLLIERYHQKSKDMPVGWSYNGVYSCQCKYNKRG